MNPRPRRHLLRLTAYPLPARDCGRSRQDLFLDQNENFAPVNAHALTAACSESAFATRYPDADAKDLRRTIAEIHGLDPDRIVCGRGIMELISLLALVYLEPGTSVVTSEFGYLYFQTASEIAGAEVRKAPESEFTPNAEAIVACTDDNTRLVFLANPGNPTGCYLPRKELVRVRESLGSSVILVIDEAYAEFVEPESYQHCFDMTDCGATVVLRTFSKIYGLAGLRIGWGYFPAEIAAALRVVIQPNAVTGPSQAAATAAVRDQRHVQRLRDATIASRDSFIRSMRDVGLSALPSQGNFVLLRFDSPDAAADADRHLRELGIRVRAMHTYSLPDCLRVTIGTAQQMRRVVESIETWVAGR